MWWRISYKHESKWNAYMLTSSCLHCFLCYFTTSCVCLLVYIGQICLVVPPAPLPGEQREEWCNTRRIRTPRWIGKSLSVHLIHRKYSGGNDCWSMPIYVLSVGLLCKCVATGLSCSSPPMLFFSQVSFTTLSGANPMEAVPCPL